MGPSAWAVRGVARTRALGGFVLLVAPLWAPQVVRGCLPVCALPDPEGQGKGEIWRDFGALSLWNKKG